MQCAILYENIGTGIDKKAVVEIPALHFCYLTLFSPNILIRAVLVAM